MRRMCEGKCVGTGNRPVPVEVAAAAESESAMVRGKNHAYIIVGWRLERYKNGTRV